MRLLKRPEFQLLLFAAAMAGLFVVAVYFPPLLDFLYAINKAVYSGFSLGKLLVSFVWLIACSLITALAVKLEIAKKLKGFEKALLFVFIAFVSVGFLLGALHFKEIAEQYKPRWMLATIIYEPGYKNWEASKFYHNHFPKVTLYYAEKLLGLDFGQKFDDGKPWFDTIPNAEQHAIVYLAIIVLAIIFFFAYTFSISDKLSLFDFFLLSASALGFFIYILDGGIAAAPLSSVIFMFSLFVARRYFRFCKSQLCTGLAALSAGISANFLSVAIFDYYVPVSTFQLFFLLFLFFSYVLFFETKKLLSAGKKITFSGLAVFLIILLLFIHSYNETMATLVPYMSGKMLVDYNALGYKNAEPGTGLFIYGLPADITKEQLARELSKFGEIIEIDKTGWTAFAKIKPHAAVTDKQIARELEAKFNPSTYLYADELALRPIYEPIYIYWPEPTDSKKWLRDKFNDIEIVERIEKGRETILLAKVYTGPTWQLLSVLTEIKENGYAGKVIVGK